MTDGGVGDETAVSDLDDEPSEREQKSSTGAGTPSGQTGDDPTPAIRPVSERALGSPAAPPGEVLEYTTDKRSLSATVQVHWGIRTSITAIVAGVILTVVLSNFGLSPEFGPVIIGVLVGVGLLWVALRYRRWVYQVRGDSLYLERGVVTQVRTLVPYVRIQHVDTSQGPLERALGLSTLVVYTAGSRGADVSIPGLTLEEARDLQQRVKELAIEAEGGDAL